MKLFQLYEKLIFLLTSTVLRMPDAGFLIHSTNPKSRLVGIVVFAHHVRPSVRPHFSNLEKQNNRKQCSQLA